MTQTAPKPTPPKTVHFTNQPAKQSIEEELRSDIVTMMLEIGETRESNLKTMLEISKASLGRSQMTLHQIQDSRNPDEEKVERFKIMCDLLSDDVQLLTKVLKERKRGDIQWNL